MKTFIELYTFLQTYSENTLRTFIEDKDDKWTGKEKQESVFRLFAYLSLIPGFVGYVICDGNYNLGTVTKNTDKKKLFQKNLNDKGDKSDLTLIQDNIIIATSSKNKTQYGINDLDIDNINSIYSDMYKHKYTLKLCLVVPCKQTLFKIASQSEETSFRLKKDVLNNNTLIYDWNDLNVWYREFKTIYGTVSYEQMVQCDKIPLVLRFHQEVAIARTLDLLKSHKQILWGHIPRSGKTYIMGGAIIASSNKNFLLITTAPNETYKQYNDMLFEKYNQFHDFNIINLNGSTKKPKIGDKNIVIASKQFLQSKGVKDDKVKQIKWLKDMKFDMRFIDESHNGGTTELASKVMDTYGIGAFTVFITATYMKPCNTFSIPKEAWITWDLEDIKLCKTISQPDSLVKLVKKHGSILGELYTKYTNEEIIATYLQYPDLQLMTWDFKNEVKDAILKTYKDTNDGFSTDSIFLLKNKDSKPIEEFQDEDAVVKLCHTIFGKSENTGLFTVRTKDSIFDRIEKIVKNGNVNSRWFSIDEPLTVLAFMPCGLQNTPIDMLHNTFMTLLQNKNLLPEFEIVCINSKANGGTDAVQIIEDARTNVKRLGKKGLFVLSGRMCSLAVSIHHCDIVLMMNNTESLDAYFQMMYRSMTEAKNKRMGFVVDLNLQRISSVIIDYAMRITTIDGETLSLKNAIKYILEQRLIGFNNDNWMHDYFGLTNVNIDSIVEKMYNIYTSHPTNAIETIMRTLELKLKIMDSDQKLFNQMFHTTTTPKNIKEAIEDLTRDTEVKKGIDMLEVESRSSDNESDKSTEKVEKNVNIISDVIKHLLPLMCLLTIHSTNTNTFDEMCKFIEQSPEEKDVLIAQLTTWWGKKSKMESIMTLFKTIYEKYLKSNNEFTNTVMRIKEMFSVAKGNADELSKLIDKYLIPQELEKKQNAEVSTPYSLRHDMLNAIPSDFWKTSHTLFEPCVGKGGFLLDIVSRFMEGLKNEYPDEEKRYKHIVEECLYWSDINPTNIWICRLLLDPFGKYDLKYNEGNTLDIDINDKWDLEGFDAVIGNPPYQPVSNGKKGGKSLWPDFVEYALKHINQDGYLVYVHPALWRKPRNALWTTMCKYKFHKISIHNDQDGNKLFKATTRFDWYVLQKTNTNIITTIIEEDRKEYKTTLNKSSFIPNFGNNIFAKVRAKIPEVGYLNAERDSACHSSRDYVQDKQDEKHKYIIVNAVSKTHGVRYLYSSKPHPHQFDKKVIFSNGRHIEPIYDNGQYGVSEGGIYILVDSDEEGEKIVKYLRTDFVSYLIKATKWSNFETSKDVFHNIAHPKEIKQIDENHLCEYFNLTESEIQEEKPKKKVIV